MEAAGLDRIETVQLAVFGLCASIHNPLGRPLIRTTPRVGRLPISGTSVSSGGTKYS